MASIRMKRGYSVSYVVKDLSRTILTLWVGGTIITEIGEVVNGTTSPFFEGFELIGWTVDNTGLVTSTTGTGILTVVGLIGVAQIVLKFVDLKM